MLRRAMLPMDGNIAEHVPDIVAAYARLVPLREWPHVTVTDFTAGSCLLPMTLAASGVRRLVVNDAAPRTQLAARALFGGVELDWTTIRRLVTAQRPRLARHSPSFHFAADYLTAEVADVFDRLYYAQLPAAAQPVYRYLALRWVQGFAPSGESDFDVLPTHDYGQLLDDLEHDWHPYVRRVRRKLAVLKQLARDINAGVVQMRGARATVYGEDMLTLSTRMVFGRRAFVAANPPTRGVDEYVLDDQILHSLLANRWLPLSRCRESAERFWTRRVSAVLSRVPAGSHVLVWGGDGAMSWSACRTVWERYGVLAASKRLSRAGWAIVERR